MYSKNPRYKHPIKNCSALIAQQKKPMNFHSMMELYHQVLDLNFKPWPTAAVVYKFFFYIYKNFYLAAGVKK